MLRILKKQGFASFVEIVVAAVIFLIATFSILTTTAMLQPHGTVSYTKLDATYAAKGVVEWLYQKVEANSWIDNAGPLATGVKHTNTIGSYTVNWELVTVTGNYPPNLAPRQLFMNVYYSDL